MVNFDGHLRNMTSLYLTYGDRMLLLYRQGSKVVNNVWIGSAGGHFEEGELNDAKACVLRELTEELQIDESYIENLSLRYITLRRKDDEIRQNYYFFAELKDACMMELSSNEGQLKWFSLEEVKELEMPFTAKYVVRHWLDNGRYSEDIYVGIAGEKGVCFSELTEF